MLDGAILTLVLMAVAGFCGYLLRYVVALRRIQEAEDQAHQILRGAEQEADMKTREAVREAQEAWERTQTRFAQEAEASRHELRRMEEKLIQREAQLERRFADLELRHHELQQRDERLKAHEDGHRQKSLALETLYQDQLQKLEQIGEMSKSEAKEELMGQMLSEARSDVYEQIRRMEAEAKDMAQKRASFYTSLAIQRFAADHVVESAVSVVALPNEEMKGRIIGREGRNIRAFETATGVDLVIDDTPDAVVVSGFDPIRREIARLTLERLVADGRIHPGRIEEMVEKVRVEMEDILREHGENAAFAVGIDDLHPDLIKLLGRLRYRTSYSQNVLQHVQETAFLAGVMAAELGADERLARRAGLLHDIGKAADRTTQGTHVQIGQEIAQRYNEPDVVLNAIGCHHEDEEPRYIEAILVAAADALSAARPGARREMLEAYVKRLRKLEEIGDSFEGVEKTYAIQAGREIRIVVHPETVTDAETHFLARNIADRIEQEMVYPGQIKVTILRETRTTEYAR
jgi:ribonuclease Y